MWIRAEKGEWVNLEQCESIQIWDEIDEYSITAMCRYSLFHLKTFKTIKEAQEYLDSLMLRLFKDAEIIVSEKEDKELPKNKKKNRKGLESSHTA